MSSRRIYFSKGVRQDEDLDYGVQAEILTPYLDARSWQGLTRPKEEENQEKWPTLHQADSQASEQADE